MSVVKFIEKEKIKEGKYTEGFGYGGLLQLCCRGAIGDPWIADTNYLSQCFNINDTMKYFYVSSKTGLATCDNIEKEWNENTIFDSLCKKMKKFVNMLIFLIIIRF